MNFGLILDVIGHIESLTFDSTHVCAQIVRSGSESPTGSQIVDVAPFIYLGNYTVLHICCPASLPLIHRSPIL
jgi:hypothetical protein